MSEESYPTGSKGFLAVGWLFALLQMMETLRSVQCGGPLREASNLRQQLNLTGYQMNHERHIHLSGFPYRIPLTSLLLGHEEVIKSTFNQTDGSKYGLFTVGFWDRLERAQFDKFISPKDCNKFIQKTEDSFMALCNKNSTISWFSSKGNVVSVVSQIGVEKSRTFFEYTYARRINRVFTLRKDQSFDGVRMIALAVYSTQSPINYTRQVTYVTNFTSSLLNLGYFELNDTAGYVAVYEKGGAARIEYYQYRSSGAIFRSMGEYNFNMTDKTLEGIFREYAVLLCSDKKTYEIYLLSPDPESPPEEQNRLKHMFLMNITANSEHQQASMGVMPGTMKRFDITTEDLFWMIAGNSIYLFGKSRTPQVYSLTCSFNGPPVDGSWRLLGMDLSDSFNRLFLLHNTSHVLVMQRNFGFVKALESPQPVDGIGAVLLNGKRSPSIIVADGEILDLHSQQELEINFDHAEAFTEKPVIQRKLTVEFTTKQNTLITFNLTLNIVESFRSLQVGELFKGVHLYDNEINTKTMRSIEIPNDAAELVTSLPRLSISSEKIPNTFTLRLDQIETTPDYCMVPDRIIVNWDQISEFSLKISSTLSSKGTLISQVYPGYLLMTTVARSGTEEYASMFAVMVRYSPKIKGPFQHPYLVHIKAEANSLPEVLMPLPVNIGTNASSVVSISAISTSMVSIVLKRGRRFERIRYSLDPAIPTSSYYYDDDCANLVAHSADNTIFDTIDSDTAGNKIYLLYRGTELFNIVVGEFQNATFRNSSSGWIYGKTIKNQSVEGFVIMFDAIDIARIFFIPELGIKDLKPAANKEGVICLRDDSPIFNKWIGIRYTGAKLMVDIKARSAEKNSWAISADIPVKLEKVEYPNLRLKLTSGMYDYSLNLHKPTELPVLSRNSTKFNMDTLLALNSSVASINFRSNLPANVVNMSCFLTKRKASDMKHPELFKQNLVTYEGKKYEYLHWDKHTEALIVTQEHTSSGVVFAVRNMTLQRSNDGTVVGAKTANVLGIVITPFKPLIGSPITLVKGLHRSVYGFFFCESSTKIYMLTVRDIYSHESATGMGAILQSNSFSRDCPASQMSNPICSESRHRKPFLSCALRCDPSKIYAFEIKLFSQVQTQIAPLATFSIPPEITSVQKLFVLPTLGMVVVTSSLKAYYYSIQTKAFIYTDNYVNSEQPDWIISHGNLVMYRLQNKEERFFEIFKERILTFDYNSSVAVSDWNNVYIEVVGLKEDQLIKFNIEELINIKGSSHLSYYLYGALGLVALISVVVLVYHFKPKKDAILNNEAEQERLDMYASMTDNSDFTRDPSDKKLENNLVQRKSRSEKDAAENNKAFDIDQIQQSFKRHTKVG